MQGTKLFISLGRLNSPPLGKLELVRDARKRLHKAVDAVGQDLDEVLITTCCLNVGLVEMEKKLGWPNRSGKLVLKIALRRLAQHYGYLPASRASASARILETIA
jgi:hypothetical protein